MQYTLEKKLHETLYGELYKAKDLTGCPVAVKLSAVSEGLKNGEDPMNEATLLAKLGDPRFQHEAGSQYILKLLDKFELEHKGTKYFCTVMELAQGDLLEKLQALATSGRNMPFKVVRKYFVQIAQGLLFVQSHGISHLDLSLENILIVNEGARICDFGQAETRRFFKDSSTHKGKARYICPEIYRKEEFDGFKADIWSLGVILWAMITGSLLYEKPDASDPYFALLMHGRRGIQDLLKAVHIEDVPVPVIELLAGMLNVEPGYRWSLAQILAHSWVDSKPTIPQSPMPSSPMLKTRRLGGTRRMRSPLSPPSPTRYDSPASPPASSLSTSFSKLTLPRTPSPPPLLLPECPPSPMSTHYSSPCLSTRSISPSPSLSSRSASPSPSQISTTSSDSNPFSPFSMSFASSCSQHSTSPSLSPSTSSTSERTFVSSPVMSERSFASSSPSPSMRSFESSSSPALSKRISSPLDIPQSPAMKTRSIRAVRPSTASRRLPPGMYSPSKKSDSSTTSGLGRRKLPSSASSSTRRLSDAPASPSQSARKKQLASNSPSCTTRRVVSLHLSPSPSMSTRRLSQQTSSPSPSSSTDPATFSLFSSAVTQKECKAKPNVYTPRFTYQSPFDHDVRWTKKLPKFD